jgi:hypothetical protein
MTLSAAELKAQPVKPSTRGRAVHLLGEPDETTPAVDEKGHVLPTITPFLAGGAKGETITPKGDFMPRGKRSNAEPIDEPLKRKKPGPKPGAKRKARAIAVPRFGVFEDGSVQVNLPGCTGMLAPDEAQALVAFIGTRKGRA